MQVDINDDSYNIISSSNTSSWVSTVIYPEFEVILDEDHNGIKDEWELPLAEKFCPSFKLHSAESINKWIAPEPVEIMTHTMYWNMWYLSLDHYGDFLMWSTDNVNYSWYTSPFYCEEGGLYFVVGHFEWAGLNGNDPDSWHAAYQNERDNNNFRHTIYVHFFIENGEVVIQYWIFYPFNDGYNNHEGDWEHINVIITDQNPSIAEIDRIDFYFHYKVQTRNPSQCEFEGGTHVKIYVGGSGSIDFPFPNSHAIADGGSYPELGWWDEVDPVDLYDEWVAGLGLYVPYSAFIDGNPNDGRGIVILPEPDKIDYDENPGMSWLKGNVAFGHLWVNSPFDWLPFSVGNNAVGGPFYNPGWNETGAVDNDKGEFEYYSSMPHQ